MPKIQWLNLPVSPRQHLFDRAKERDISMQDIFALEEWRRHAPEVPDGPWYKDFGSFKLCGEGRYPRTFLLKGQAALATRSSERSAIRSSPGAFQVSPHVSSVLPQRLRVSASKKG